MLATYSTGKEYTVAVDRYRSRSQGFTYNRSKNCVTHIGSRQKICTPLPDHFLGKAVRAIGQVWNSASARINGRGQLRRPSRNVSPSSGPTYNPASWNSQCRDLAFRFANASSEGKSSTQNRISVWGGGWNKIHAELTSRPLNDGETFTVIGNKQQVGAGLCIDSCELESNFGIRWKYNCIGFYGDGTSMLATYSTGKEYTVAVDRYRSRSQGFTYNRSKNCVTHIGSRQKICTPLPDHFLGKAVRAIGQVWNSASATIRVTQATKDPSPSPSVSPSYQPSQGPTTGTSPPTPFDRSRAIHLKIAEFEAVFSQSSDDDMVVEEKADLKIVLDGARDWIIEDDLARLEAEDESLLARYCWAILNLGIATNDWYAFDKKYPSDYCKWNGIDCKTNGRIALNLDYSTVDFSKRRRLPVTTVSSAGMRQRITAGIRRLAGTTSNDVYTAVPLEEPIDGIEMTLRGEEAASNLAEGGIIAEGISGVAGASFSSQVIASLFVGVIATAATVVIVHDLEGTNSPPIPLPLPPTAAPSLIPTWALSIWPSLSSAPSITPSNPPSVTQSPSSSHTPSISTRPTTKPILVGADAPYYKTLHGNPEHRAKYHPADDYIKTILPFYDQNPDLFKQAVKAILFQKEYPPYPRYSEKTRQPDFVKDVDPIPTKEQEQFKAQYLDRTKSCDGDASKLDARVQDIQYTRWEWANNNLETFVNMMRLSGHSDKKIQNMFNGIPLWVDIEENKRSAEDYFSSFRRELAPLAKEMEEELGWRNVVFVFTGSSVNGFSQNPCKGSLTVPSWITDQEKSDVDISVHAAGVNQFAVSNADMVKLRPTIVDRLTTGVRYSPINGADGHPRYEIFGRALRDFYDKWSNILPGGLQFTVYEDNWSLPEWESRVEYA